MLRMLPMCNSRPLCMPMSSPICGPASSMVPMMPMAPAPMVCSPNVMSMFSTSTLMSEYDAQMYGRFRHVEREHPRYRHAPFDWYRPPKQNCLIIHEDAAVVTMDGPVPIGDFYRHYIYGDDYDDYDDDDSGTYTSEEYDDMDVPSYEARSVGYRRYPQRSSDFDDDDDDADDIHARSSLNGRNYSTLNPNRRPTTLPNTNRPSNYRRNRTLAGDDDFDDAASVNSTYGN
ncbi:hypothetical protein I4U23_029772 [Adineta vaga]|nr:hypothetical protein I4U23_029772 [Adineta vaga]